MNSRLGLASVVTSVAVGLLFLVETTYAFLVCESVGKGTDSGGTSGGHSFGVFPADITDCGSPEKTLKRYLLDIGYDENAASAVVGNAKSESGFETHILNGGCMVSDDFRLYTTGGERIAGADRYKGCSKEGSGAFGIWQWLSGKKGQPEDELQKYADGLGIGVTTLRAQVTFLGRQLGDDSFPWGTYYTKAVGLDRLNGLTIEDATFRLYRYVLSPGSAYCVGPDGWLPGTAESEKKGSAPYKACCTKSQRQNGTCTSYNNEKPLGWGQVNDLLANPSARQKTYNAFMKRLKNAKEALALDVSSCGTGSSGGSSSSIDSDTPTVVSVTDNDTGGETTVTVTTGAVGEQKTSNVISQTHDRVKNTPWLLRSDNKKIGVYDNGDCCGSGCSLIAVANAYGTIKGYTEQQVANFANTLASWAKDNVYSPSESYTKQMISHVGMTYKQVWSSKGTDTSKKISEIRSALASGGVIIAGGDRKETDGDTKFCDRDNHRANGDCVFTPKGHWVAIIGITADDKLVIANPGQSNGKNWVFPASTVLKYSNTAYMVK